jgi:hypothetical protein
MAMLPPYILERLLRRHLAAKSQFKEFTRRVEAHGLPVKLLQRVGRDYTFLVGSHEHVNPILNTIMLDQNTLESAAGAAPGKPIGESSAIRTVYEEATHAYLDLVADTPKFRRFIAGGERHYTGARTTEGVPNTDPMRVFQEAAGTYVGHRAALWWTVYDQLAAYVHGSRDSAYAARLLNTGQIARLHSDYNAGMAARVFGYSDEGGFLGFGAEQMETTRPLTGEMKAFLDQELLEGKIPDNFDDVPTFQKLAAQIKDAATKQTPIDSQSSYR